MSYSAVETLESHSASILSELTALIPSTPFMEWPEKGIYTGTWKVFGLYGIDGQPIPENIARCPLTANAVKEVPKMRTAGFSMLAPGCHIKPHTGYTDDVLRCHLGLIVPDGDCRLRVGDETYTWSVGRAFVFNDRVLHEAWNYTDSPRYVLLVDFER